MHIHTSTYTQAYIHHAHMNTKFLRFVLYSYQETSAKLNDHHKPEVTCCDFVIVLEDVHIFILYSMKSIFVHAWHAVMEGSETLMIKANDTDVIVIAIYFVIPARTRLAEIVDCLWPRSSSEMDSNT